jgi:hypothetical protein
MNTVLRPWGFGRRGALDPFTAAEGDEKVAEHIVPGDHNQGSSLWRAPTTPARRRATLVPLSTRAPILALVVGLVALLPACGLSGLSFVQDDRVDIVTPDDRAKVDLPVRVSWTVEDFATGSGKGSFGVFVDRTPQRQGETLAWIFRGDDACKGTSAKLCAAPRYLAQRNVFQTTSRSFTIEQVARLSGAQSGRQFHEVTVVLLDAAGRRSGEGSWSVQFEVEI